MNTAMSIISVYIESVATFFFWIAYIIRGKNPSDTVTLSLSNWEIDDRNELRSVLSEHKRRKQG